MANETAELYLPYVVRKDNCPIKKFKYTDDDKIYYIYDDYKILEKYGNCMHQVYLIDYFSAPIPIYQIKEYKCVKSSISKPYAKEGFIGNFDCISSYANGKFDKIQPITMKDIEAKRLFLSTVIKKEFDLIPNPTYPNSL